MTAALIIATYNWPEALECCLVSVLRQKELPAEVIIADDGSGEQTRRMIEVYKKNFPVPLVHVWQEDQGFRLGMIRNKAIAAAKSDYIIQTDGDIILHPSFIRDHVAACRVNHFIGGSRVLLNKDLTDRLLNNPHHPVSIVEKGAKNKMNGVHLPALSRFIEWFRKERGIYNLRGCNMSFWKRDLLDVNGYNEAISGWGREDTELAIRLYNKGVQRVFFKLQGIAFHMYHKEFDRRSLLANDEVLNQTILSQAVVCEKGLNQYLQ